MDRASNIEAKNNVMVKNWWHGVLVETSTNVTLDGNLVMNTNLRPSSETIREKPSNFFVCVSTPDTCTNVVL